MLDAQKDAAAHAHTQVHATLATDTAAKGLPDYVMEEFYASLQCGVLAHGCVRLERVFAMDMERCPVCQQGTLRIIAVMTQGSIIRKLLRHLRLAVDPPHYAGAPSRV